MAIDTAEKRGSSLLPESPWRAYLPFPDGTIGQGDRQADSFAYSGVLAAAVAVLGDVIIATTELLSPIRTVTSLIPRRTTENV